MVGVSSRAIAGDFGDRLGAAVERVLQLFNDEDTGAFAHDEAIAVAIEGAGRTRWRFVEARRKGPGSGEAAEAYEIDAGFRATANRNVGFSGSDEACGIADRLHARGTSGDRRTDRPLEAVTDGDMAGREICEKGRHGEGREALDSALIGGANRLDDCRKASDARCDHGRRALHGMRIRRSLCGLCHRLDYFHRAH